jgi:ATPase subunit of ABC transporter with duplicated ATPase domains
MILSVDIESKTTGNKLLFKGLSFTVDNNEKVAVIGRNGVGKTTLFGLLTGEDNDFAGTIKLQRNVIVACWQPDGD